MSVAVRRTQKERREATVGRLVDATINCLVEHGYRDTSISRICSSAGVSHGGLFRHFASRTALVAEATNAIGVRHVERLDDRLRKGEPLEDLLQELVAYLREATRDPLSAAWREVMVAARSDEQLREAVKPAVQRFENSIMQTAESLLGRPDEERRFGTLLLSLLHMFDSEATTAVIFETEDVERIRHRWAVDLLRQALLQRDELAV